MMTSTPATTRLPTATPRMRPSRDSPPTASNPSSPKRRGIASTGLSPAFATAPPGNATTATTVGLGVTSTATTPSWPPPTSAPTATLTIAVTVTSRVTTATVPSPSGRGGPSQTAGTASAGHSDDNRASICRSSPGLKRCYPIAPFPSSNGFPRRRPNTLLLRPSRGQQHEEPPSVARPSIPPASLAWTSIPPSDHRPRKHLSSSSSVPPADNNTKTSLRRPPLVLRPSCGLSTSAPCGPTRAVIKYSANTGELLLRYGSVVAPAAVRTQKSWGAGPEAGHKRRRHQGEGFPNLALRRSPRIDPSRRRRRRVAEAAAYGVLEFVRLVKDGVPVVAADGEVAHFAKG
mmetsp:Transcript_35678/g.114102  ORF Transcript_35678/g.114102 Transcript_35678/m.114102 type:complete len:346 (-) Transcript_35678:1662-2699(-)